MEKQNLGRGQEDALERGLTSLYRHGPSQGFEDGWRMAVRREANTQRKEKRGGMPWRLALPGFAALALTVGILLTLPPASGNRPLLGQADNTDAQAIRMLSGQSAEGISPAALDGSLISLAEPPAAADAFPDAAPTAGEPLILEAETEAPATEATTARVALAAILGSACWLTVGALRRNRERKAEKTEE